MFLHLNIDDNLIPDVGQIELPTPDAYDPNDDSNANQSLSENDDTIMYAQTIRNIAKGEISTDIWHIYNQEYHLIQNGNDDCFIGDFQLINEKRHCYGPKLAIFNSFCELFPFVDQSGASYYWKMINLEQLINRIDICSFCHTAELIIAVMKRANLSFLQPSSHKQAYIRVWRKHKIRFDHQRQIMHSDVFNVGPGKVILIADFKENLHIVLNRDSEGHEYFE
ncbi:MAG: hypothetical protein EZS28_011478 [Streblomastix strix]|uniref:Uncharacterized protein n=1 Tax=Streblomastix strix TaxID=222440 RepID=A0A5J4WE57_9EUKA|nr:MAG: hypothetical protein EZS28_011478 [Streblomastix strix]